MIVFAVYLWFVAAFNALTNSPSQGTDAPIVPTAVNQCGVQTYEPSLTQSSNAKSRRRRHKRADNGVTAEPHSWPWQVLVVPPADDVMQYPLDEDEVLRGCGGTIVAADLVVTAAHCAAKYMRYNYSDSDLNMTMDGSWYEIIGMHPNGTEFCVWPGLHNRQDKNQTCKHKGKLIVHNGFDHRRGKVANDIALLKLTKSLEFNDKVQPVCLPETMIEVGQTCYATGWGAEITNAENETHVWEYPNNLTQVVQIVHKCNELEPNDTLCAKGPLVNNQEETGNQNQSPCYGDSGGPLVCQSQDGRWVLHGVISTSAFRSGSGWPCGSGEKPGITAYASVLYHKQFIESYGKIRN